MIPESTYNALGIISGLINISSLIINIIAIINLWRIDRRTKLPINSIFMCLCIDNILQCVASQIFVTTSCFMKRWIWSDHFCTFYAMWTYWLAVTAIFMKMMLAWQHYSTVKSKTVNRITYTFLNKIKPVSICAVTALAWCSLPLFGWSSFGLEGIPISCSLNWHVNNLIHRSYNISTIVVAFLVPLIFIVTTYTRLFLFIKQNSFTPDSQENDAGHQTQMIAIKVGFAVTITFFIAWSPYAIAAILLLVNPKVLPPLSQMIPSIIAKGSTLALPLVYLLIYREFRRNVFQMLRFTSAREKQCMKSMLQRSMKQRHDTKESESIASTGT